MGNTLTAIITADASGLKKETASASDYLDGMKDAFEELKKKGLGNIVFLQEAIKQFKAALKNAANQEDFNKLAIGLSFLQKEAKKLKNTGLEGHFEGISRSTQRVATSSLGLAKIFSLFPPEVSHLTHAFDGLIESYEQIRSKTETSGQAFSQLAKSFVGPLGIGIALSVGASLLEGFGASLFETSEKAKKAAEKLKELVKPLEEISSQAAAGTAGEAAKVNALVAIIENQTKSYQERNRALNELKEINKSYFGDLTLEESKLGLVKQAAEEYTKAIIQQAVIKAFADEIGKVSVALDEQNKKLVESFEKVDKFKKALAGTTGKINIATGLPVQDPANTLGLQSANKEFAAQDKLVNGLKKQFNDLSAAITEATEKSLELKPLDDQKVEKSVNKTVELAKKLAAFFDKNTQFSVNFEVDPNESEATTLKKAAEFIQKTKAFFEKGSSQFGTFKFKPIVQTEFKIDKKAADLFQDRSIEQKVTQTFAQLKTAFEKGIDDAAARNPLVLRLKANLKLNDDFEKQLKDAADAISVAATNFFQSAFESIGEGIGNILSGKDFGSGIIDALASFVTSVGQALIKFGIIKLALDKLLKLGPLKISGPLAIGLGIAAVALGSILKNSAHNISGARAAGGPVQQGKTFLVGERGPELFTPSVGGRIIPNNQINGSGRSFSSASNNAISLNGRFVIAGKDLVYLLNQVTSSQNRTT